MMRLVRAAVLGVSFSATAAMAAPCGSFTDVDAADPFCANVTWMANRSITLGCGGTLYCPGLAVSRLAMAAFMNRLGNAVLPPNVVWVHPTGGTFHSIQAAIDSVAAAATANNPYVVKVAPGVYTGQVTMKPYVDVEGSGEGVTVISSTICGPGALPYSAATLIASDNAQLRHATVQNLGGTGVVCVAIYMSNVGGTPFHRVTAVATGATVGSFGLSMNYTLAKSVTLENMSVVASSATASSNAVFMLNNAAASVLMRDMSATAQATGLAGGALGIAMQGTGSSVTLVDVAVRVSALNGEVIGVSFSGPTVAVRHSSVQALAFGFPPVALHQSSGVARVAYTLVEGTVEGSLTCLGNFTPALAPLACL